MRVQARVAKVIETGEGLRASKLLPKPRPCEAEWVGGLAANGVWDWLRGRVRKILKGQELRY